ncbi:MAG: glycosyltransferase family 61 protein [Reichenbachiella sp.]|uniref:glycosyltransferase family 61 protein n=1 Tax=Reichenbachiella sp. TaxID=2184521 RepID=UPI0032676EDC
MKDILAHMINTLFGSLLSVRDGRMQPDPKEIKVLDPTEYHYTLDKYHISGESKPEWLSVFGSVQKFRKISYLPIQNGVLHPGGVVVRAGKVELESVLFQKEYLNKLFINRSLFFSRFSGIQLQYKSVVPLSHALSTNYYHWTMEGLTRLAIFLSQNTIQSEHIYIGIPEDAPDFIKSSLTVLFGIEDHQLIAISESVKIEGSYLPDFPHKRDDDTKHLNLYDPRGILLLNDRSKLLRVAKTYPERILISRPAETSRRLMSEKEVCERFDLTLVVLEEMRFDEQVQLFSQVKLVVGVHGAGLTNLIYTQQQPMVIELFPGDRRRSDAHCFFQLSQALGLAHHLLILEGSQSEPLSLTDKELATIAGILSIDIRQ